MASHRQHRLLSACDPRSLFWIESSRDTYILVTNTSQVNFYGVQTLEGQPSSWIPCKNCIGERNSPTLTASLMFLSRSLYILAIYTDTMLILQSTVLHISCYTLVKSKEIRFLYVKRSENIFDMNNIFEKEVRYFL